MSSKQVKTKYLNFYTSEYFETIVNVDFSDDKFEKAYLNHPSRMTPEQIKGVGYDIVRDRLYSKFLDAKYNTLYQAKLGVSAQVIEQIQKAINFNFIGLATKVIEGSVKKYGDNKLTLTRLIVGDFKKKITLTITPTLKNTNNQYFSVTYCIAGSFINHETLQMSDEELLNEVSKLQTYLNDISQPITFGIDTITHKCENQYIINCNLQTLSLYDIEIINLYHTLAKAMNDTFGTDFVYSEKAIKTTYKHEIFDNIHFCGKFMLSYVKNDSAELRNEYYYKDDKTKAVNFQCFATYGKWSVSDLKRLLTMLYPYVSGTFLHDTSKKALEDKYKAYDRIGIRYAEKPTYFDDLLWV